MPRPTSLLPALVAAATLAPLAAVAPAQAAPSAWGTTRSVSAPVRAAAGEEPLRMTLGSLSPAYVPERGRIELTGTVTNVSDERWRVIKVYAFLDDVPLTSSAEVQATSDTPVDAEVGDRITEPGTFDTIGSLAPGETASYSLTLRRDELPVSEAGVYWFGTHALGNTTEARDMVADGRVRTLLPLVPPGSGQERASLVVPLRHSVRHTPTGRLRAPRVWARDLSVGGRLRDLVDLGAAAGATPVSWLLDPAVPDAAARLAAGNPPRSLAAPGSGPGRGPDDEGGSDEEPDDVEDAAATAGGDRGGGVASGPAEAWLGDLEQALGGDEVLTLPYGDPDVAAVAHHAPQFYDRAVRRTGTQLAQWRVRSRPAVAPPDGFLPPDALAVLNGDEAVVLGERALDADAGSDAGSDAGTGTSTGADPVRATGSLGDHSLLFSSAGTARGGPGPGDPLDEIALRQRFLAEAAVRLLFHDRTPLLSVLPDDWTPSSPETFWEGLDEVPWLELTDTASLGRGEPVSADELAYPSEQELLELDPANFTAAEQLIARGATLDNVLPRTDLVARETLDQALTSLSYAERDRAVASRLETADAVGWIQQRLERVRIKAPRGVTLSSARGDMFATVTNRLDHPVTVVLRTVSLGAVEVEDSAPIELAARARQSVALQAEAAGQGVHYVRVEVTDEAGTPLGAAQRVAIRSAEVSQVIWLILGTGVGLLFVAIGLRLVRRVRRERAS